MTIIIDDAGSGDLLFGVVIGAFRDSTREFKYRVIDVKYFQPKLFSRKLFLKQSSKIVSILLAELKPRKEEEIHLCSRNTVKTEFVELRLRGKRRTLVKLLTLMK
jgi:hypothetical protein